MNETPARGRFLWRWFVSRTVRRAVELRKQVRRLVNEQRDQLASDAIQDITESDRKLGAVLANGAEKAAVEKGMAELEAVANERLLPYPNGALRENTKEILVAVTVIFGFTTFFLQLTKIPTNSLLPTLYGITSEDVRNQPQFQIPGRLQRVFDYWVHGISYYQVIARSDGELEEVEAPQLVLPFVKKQRLRVGGEWYTVWFPPDRFEDRAGLRNHRHYRAGEDIVKLKVVAGDHLLVDRISYNFRRPKRGEIFVFKTKRIAGLPEGQLYIKRLVAMGGEHIRIGNDQHLVVDGQRLDASTPHFENVYTFHAPPKEGEYFGHVNEKTANAYGRYGLARLFPNENCEHVVAPHHYFAMGDNTMNSFDSRDWGDVPCQNVIGKCWFVYWPFTERFGWGTR